MKRFALSSVLFFAACGQPVEPPTHTHDAVTELPFVAKVGTQNFACGTDFTLGTTQSTWKPRDLRFYVHDIVLIDEDGAEVPFTLANDDFQGEGAALLDFEDASGDCSNGTVETHATLTGNAEGRHYAAIAFTLGLPFPLNHRDATAQAKPFSSSGMFWSWNAGYKFLKVDGFTTGLAMGHNVHVGSTGCMAGAAPNSVERCAAENRVRVRLDGFAANSTIVFDVAKLFEGSDLDTNQIGAPGCMSGATDTDCAPIFSRLGLPFGGAAATTQTVFSLGTK